MDRGEIANLRQEPEELRQKVLAYLKPVAPAPESADLARVPSPKMHGAAKVENTIGAHPLQEASRCLPFSSQNLEDTPTPGFGDRSHSHLAPTRVAIVRNGHIEFITVSEIIAIEAQGSYVRVHGVSGVDILRETISSVAQKLKANGFVRIHRSTVVNREHVVSLKRSLSGTGEYLVTLCGGRTYTVSRSYKSSLCQLVELSIGVEAVLRQVPKGRRE